MPRKHDHTTDEDLKARGRAMHKQALEKQDAIRRLKAALTAFELEHVAARSLSPQGRAGAQMTADGFWKEAEPADGWSPWYANSDKDNWEDPK